MPNLNGVERTFEYNLVSAFYGKKVAARSKVYKIHHVTEGVYILNRLCASTAAKRAFCLHPMIQDDEELKANFISLVVDCDKTAIALAMEYRNVANRYLSYRIIDEIEEIELSPLDDVNMMLIADKVQNRKDFELYHMGKHRRSAELDVYFKNWLKRLDVSEADYQELVLQLQKEFPDHKV